MELLPMRSSVHATAVRPDSPLVTDSPYLFAGADETANCGQTTFPPPPKRIACIVSNPYPVESTHITSAPLPTCTFLTKVSVSFIGPSGTTTNPVGLHCE